MQDITYQIPERSSGSILTNRVVLMHLYDRWVHHKNTPYLSNVTAEALMDELQSNYKSALEAAQAKYISQDKVFHAAVALIGGQS